MQIVAVDYEKIHCRSFILIYISAVHIINFQSYCITFSNEFLEDKKKQLGEELGPVIKSIKLNLRPPQFHWMIGARSRRHIASVGTLSIDLVYENLYVSPCLQWWLIHRKIPHGFILRNIKMPIFTVDLLEMA